jgi:hypothetical protein
MIIISIYEGNTDGPAAFQEFLYNHIIPSCFVAPSKPEFDLNDAQTMLVSEKLVFIKGGRSGGEWGSEARLVKFRVSLGG